jgi:hypothetical protein
VAKQRVIEKARFNGRSGSNRLLSSTRDMP